MKFYVYVHICPQKFNIRYCGKGSGNRAYTINSNQRYSHHKNWILSLEKKGLKPIVKILKYFEDEKEAYRYERNLIKNMKRKGINLTNTIEGGDSGAEGLKGIEHPRFGKTFEELFGYKKAKELKNAMSKRNSGEGNPMHGRNDHTYGLKKWVKERDYVGNGNPAFGKKRDDLSEYNKKAKKGKTWEELYGKERAKEMRSELSIKNKGKKRKPFTEEHKKNISIAVKNRKRNSRKILDLQDNTISTAKELIVKYNISKSVLYGHLRGNFDHVLNRDNGALLKFKKII